MSIMALTEESLCLYFDVSSTVKPVDVSKNASKLNVNYTETFVFWIGTFIAIEEYSLAFLPK